MTSIKELVDELYNFRDYYFESHTLDSAKDKTKDVENKLKDVLNHIEADALKDLKNVETEFLLHKGRAINILPDHDQRAEDCLAKAVKRNPKSWQSWNELGMCYWKKGELQTAKNCFEGALKQERNKISLQSLSMILRQLGKTPDEKLNNIYNSLEIAKEALQLDMTDGLSWYCLGNANLNLFFLANQNSKILKQSMQAYSKALEDKVAKTHPDLHLNQATALRYEGAYQEALDAYKRATAYDPLWNEPEEKSKELLRYLEQIGTMTKQKGCLKARQLRSMVKSIKTHHIGPYGPKPNSSNSPEEAAKEKKMLSQLKEGVNKGAIVVGKVVCHIPNPVPFTFCMIDEEESCVSVSVYNQADGKGVVIGDSVAIPDPCIQNVNVSCDDKRLEFINIRVFSPVTLAVNGRLLPSDIHAPATVSVTCKSD